MSTKKLTKGEVEEKEFSLQFWGSGPELDDLLENYLNSVPNKKFGVTYAQLENFFVYRRELCSERQLRSHLRKLQRFKTVKVFLRCGVKFYKFVKIKED